MKYTDRQLDEIDRLVAEHVMGWKPADRKVLGWGDGPLVWSTGDNKSPTHQAFEPTRFGDDMLAVVEKMLAEYHIHMEGHWRGPWTVEFCQPSREWSATAPTLPLAVALAALAAVGHPYKEHGHA